MARRRKVYEGTVKDLYEGPEPGTLVQYYKDDVNFVKDGERGIVTGKGVLNNRISEHIMLCLGQLGIPNHFVRRLNMREQLIREVEMLPLEVMVRNVVAGSMSERLGIAEGTPLPRSIVEYRFKGENDARPLVTEEHITCFGWATPQDLDEIMALALRINDVIFGLFAGVGIRLVDFKVEFGRLYSGEDVRVVLADEISPDNCRLWDVKSNERLDHDRVRDNVEGAAQAYQEVARRLGILPDAGPRDLKGPAAMQ